MTPTSRQLRRYCIYSAALACVFSAGQLRAGVVCSTGLNCLPSSPAGNVLPGTQEPTLKPILFPEVLGGVVGAGGLPVDHNGSSISGVQAIVSGPLVSPSLIKSTLPEGTGFDSYFFHFDPSSTGGIYGDTNPPDVWATFSTQIIGLQLFSSSAALQKPAGTAYIGTLENGDATVAANGGQATSYYPQGLVSRGLDEDAISISADRRQIWFVGNAFGAEIDQVRILVAVPEPTSVMLAFAGLLGMSFLGITRVGRACRS